MSDEEIDNTQTEFLEEMAAAARVERLIRTREDINTRKRQRLEYLHRLRDEGDMLDEELAREEMVSFMLL